MFHSHYTNPVGRPPPQLLSKDSENYYLDPLLVPHLHLNGGDELPVHGSLLSAWKYQKLHFGPTAANIYQHIYSWPGLPPSSLQCWRNSSYQFFWNKRNAFICCRELKSSKQSPIPGQNKAGGTFASIFKWNKVSNCTEIIDTGAKLLHFIDIFNFNEL